jgi:light-regulated signal transduction histidine kinase (bacteriophytochrome)
MTGTHLHQLDSVSERTDGPSDQASRLLRSMQKVCRHDLPNQLVVLQSLLKLLSMEESERLSEDGREFVRRLQSATRYASSLARFLKEMASLNGRSACLEPIALGELGRELQGGVQHLHPNWRFTFAWDWQVPTIIGDVRLYVQAILELVAGLLHPGAGACRLTGTSQEHADILELAFYLEAQPDPDCTGADLAAGRPRVVEERFEIVLAREWLALCGAGVEVLTADAAECRFSLIVPNR